MSAAGKPQHNTQQQWQLQEVTAAATVPANQQADVTEQERHSMNL
jgi:hypothetical protein